MQAHRPGIELRGRERPGCAAGEPPTSEALATLAARFHVTEEQVMSEKPEKIATPDETRGIGAEIAAGVAGGVASGVAGAVAQQVLGSIKPQKPKK